MPTTQTARPATDDDAATIRDMDVEFFTSIGTQDFRAPTLDSIRKHLAQPEIAAYIEPATGVYCEAWLLSPEDGRKEGRIGRWYPRGVSIQRLCTALAPTLRELKRRFPDAGAHLITGKLKGGVDEQGRPDHNLSMSKALETFFTVGGETVITILETNGEYHPAGRLDDLIAALEEKGL